MTTCGRLMGVATLSGSWLAASPAGACEPSFLAQVDDAQRTVAWMHPDKPGQMRVFTRDGSVFTAGQALWMRGELALVVQACARNDQPEATRYLSGVQALLDAHRRLP